MAKSRNKKKPRFTIHYISLITSSIVLIIGIIYFTVPDKVSPPILFEETHPHSEQLRRCIHLIDKSIADGFYNRGVPQKNIVFLSVLPRQKDSYRWNFCEVEARIPKRYSVLKIGEEIKGRITHLPTRTEITVDRKSDNEITYEIYCEGLYTHRLKIIRESKNISHRFTPPKISIIIDDLGYDTSLANELLGLDLSLTFSVLPFTPHTQLIARKAWNAGREIMLHLPMEPMDYPAVNPGEGVLLVSMDKEKIVDTMNKDLSQIPFVAGVNNHMGSRFTENEEKMTVVLSELKKKRLYYIDSRTSCDTVGFDVAKKLDLKTARRDIFLDNNLSENTLKLQMEKLLSVARHKGSAIGIGHPHKKTFDILKHFHPTLVGDVELVPASSLVSN
jgi:polysaccharide deacetylase 2 family uncharacterized protein YibQ